MDFQRCKTIVVALTKGLTMAKTEQAREMDNKSKKNYVARWDVFKWTEHMDDAIIDSLIRQQRLGNRVDSVFTTASKDNMECFDMFHGANGFVWGPENKMWAAKPRTWKAFVKAKPKSKMDDYSNWPS
ncbi:hypothetical protein OIU74_019388 [Salix koriyanagi]|uniref:Uncharacterized protein n=1 Tax=Salix koriyanagi TaxID=2511006 RepID=A0A9Q0P3G0_9ROSI|nr:hypothetical protein OIU74_019388 [Salix koriyanagi]